VTARQDPVAVEERLAHVLEQLAAECRKLAGSSGIHVDSLGAREAECRPSPREAHMPTSPTTPTALLTRAEVAGLLRVGDRTLARLRSDPRAKFPQPIKRARALRWRRGEVEKWIAGGKR
jgi:predicted DNA-binding transcriptional regulator AlpA